jgi:uncharacterized protein (TIGR00255 family)
MSVRSMTGFARVRKALPEGELVVSVKSVNHRGLDLHFHMAPELDPFENALRKLIKEYVARGHFQLQVSLNRSNGATTSESFLNRPLMEAYLKAFAEAAEQSGIAASPDLNAAFRIPAMFRAEAALELGGEFEASLTAAVREALAALNQFREREGSEIAVEMRGRAGRLREFAARLELIRAGATAAFQTRLKERLAELLQGAGLDAQRLAQEAALLADRSDISEELIRLKTHAAESEELLRAGGDVGKKLDFLLQEMNRETNTILSKTGGLGDTGMAITTLGLEAKSEIEKIREQALNLE